jgi:hypothetical protein
MFVICWLVAMTIAAVFPWLTCLWINKNEEIPTRMTILGFLYGIEVALMMTGLVTIVRCFYPKW